MRRVLILLALATAAACGPPARDAERATLGVGELLGGSDTLHARALAPRPFDFPVDHGPHPDFRTEWWYFTGTLTAANGRAFGYQLTFFRSALMDSAAYTRAFADAGDTAARSGFRTRHAYMAHFTVTDVAAAAFHVEERFARAAAGLAGAQSSPFRVWLEDFTAESVANAAFPARLLAQTDAIGIDLVVAAGRSIVLQGERGLSRKGPEPGNASYYYSMTRMPTRGTIRIGDEAYAVSGASWLDREWGTSALSAGLAGWDWLSLQLSDSTELMMYRLRRDDGSADPFSAATFVAADGTAVSLAADEFTMTPVRTWRAADGVVYPVGWHVEAASLDLAVDISAALDDQELDVSVRYWEGMVNARGTRGGVPVSGRGYLELTGYADPPQRMH